MKQIRLDLKNKPGQVAEVCTALGKAGVNIKSLFGKALNSEGVFHFVTNDPDTAEDILRKSGFKPEVTDMVTMTIKDRPGELGKITREIAHKGINLESIYLLERKGDSVTIALKPAELEKAREILKD